MTHADFSGFYQAVHKGRSPFRWQTELMERVASGCWPDTIELPTSSGKTSAIDIAVFLLALEAGKPMNERRAALRTFFVVDRRIVVDEAYEHALRIARALQDAADPITQTVAERLGQYGGRVPLQVSRMRGGMVRDSGWAEEPNQPLVCLTTVDQIGSRLLFRGYQVNDRTRPVHAGLIGIDSLIVLDEAHLPNAFAETVQALATRYATPSEKFPRIVTMSATAKRGIEVFAMKAEWMEADSATLKPRLAAAKRTELRDEPKKRFEDEMVSAAKELGGALKTGVVGVIANTIAAAREVFGKLPGDKVLLIGRNRPWCAERLWDLYKPRIEARTDRVSEGLLYVAATQTVEVGANISFDALVTESAPIDALRQRFGRLNRLGLVDESRAVIVFRPKGDPVYGERTEATWKFLKEREPVDFGVLACGEMLSGQDLDGMVTRRSRAPLIFPGHLDLWTQTNPAPKPDPDVAPFLHGPDALEAADVQIVWRQDLVEGDEEHWAELIDLVPPVSREALAMPVASVRRWLHGMDANASDLEGIQLESTEDGERRDPKRKPKALVTWNSKGAELGDDRAIRPGQTIVVPVSYGGADQFGWKPDAIPEDLFDAINKDEAGRGSRKRVVRLELAANGQEDAVKLIRAWRADPAPELCDLIVEALGLSAVGARIDRSGRIATWPKRKAESAIEPVTQEYDETDDNSFTRRLTLKAHTAGVVRHARRYATGCGLAPELVDDIVLSAELHDWGKCDERFQAWLAGKPFDGREYFAKSSGERTQSENRTLRARAGYPEDARHEAASVMAACASGLLSRAHDRDLVLHLIGTHHGWGRPWFPVWNASPGFRVTVEGEGQPFECSDGLELARVDSGWVERFAMLNERYGCWGLAYLEAILRRADCMQSRKESEDAAN